MGFTYNDSKKLKKEQQSLSINESKEVNQILCNHCKRTKLNKISCLGMCVADSDY